MTSVKFLNNVKAFICFGIIFQYISEVFDHLLELEAFGGIRTATQNLVK